MGLDFKGQDITDLKELLSNDSKELRSVKQMIDRYPLEDSGLKEGEIY